MWSDDGHRWCTRGETTGGWWRTSVSFADLRRKNRSVGSPWQGRAEVTIQSKSHRQEKFCNVEATGGHLACRHRCLGKATQHNH